MIVKFKKLHPEARTPTKAHITDAGFDLYSLDNGFFLHENHQLQLSTGIAVEIPKGYVGLIFPRSSICNTNLSLTNSVGVIDSGYRGEIKFKFRTHLSDLDINKTSYNKGSKIGQLIVIPYPEIELVKVDELSDSERGTNGFGSSGL